jgi:peptidyl-prolyl cis-trans isomerase B (cyclophilin B)
MNFQIKHWFMSLLMIGTLLTAGCAANTATSNPPTDNATAAPISQTLGTNMSNLPQLEGKATVVMTVKGQPITIEVDGTKAPITAGNFVDLVQRGVYDGLAFHRVVREPQPFVVQGGDPQGKDPKFPVGQMGTGGFIDEQGNRRFIPLEITPEGAESPIYSKTFQMARISQPPALPHTKGAVAMARSQPPDSASSQFYFALDDLSFLDGNYAVFGYVTDGMNVVDQIQQGDRIESAKVTQGAENLKK